MDKFYQRRGGITFLNESPAKVLPRSPHTLREVLAQPASRVAPSWLNQMILTLIGLAVLAGLVYLAATVPEYAPPNPPYEDGALALTVTPPIGQRVNYALVENEPITSAGVKYKVPRPRAGRVAFRLTGPQRLQPEPSRPHS